MDKAVSIERRLAAMRELHDAGIRTTCFISPIFPGITDVSAIIDRVKEQCNLVWLENLNLRDGYKAVIMDYIAEKYPNLLPLYREIYTDGSRLYWETLDRIIRTCAEKSGLEYMWVMIVWKSPLMRRQSSLTSSTTRRSRNPQRKAEKPMPELPEVETIRRIIEPQLAGQTILHVTINNPQIVAYPEAEAFEKLLTGQMVKGISRRGKFLTVHFESGDRMTLHLRMTGQLLGDSLRLSRREAHPSRCGTVRGRQIRYVDVRRFGRFLVSESV